MQNYILSAVAIDAWWNTTRHSGRLRLCRPLTLVDQKSLALAFAGDISVLTSVCLCAPLNEDRLRLNFISFDCLLRPVGFLGGLADIFVGNTLNRSGLH